MKFRCPHCKKIFDYDMRKIPYQGKKRIWTYCESAGKNVFMMPVKKNPMRRNKLYAEEKVSEV